MHPRPGRRHERVFVILLFLGATVAFALVFLTRLAERFDLGALGLALLAGGLLSERLVGRPG